MKAHVKMKSKVFQKSFPVNHWVLKTLEVSVGCLKINEDKSYECGPHTDAGVMPHPDASLKPGTIVEFQSKTRMSHFIKSVPRVVFCAKRDSRTTP